jgi:Zn-dependent membrane protease YugP
MVVSFWLQYKLKSKFKTYSATRLASDLSGEEAAKMMLRDNGIFDVKVLSVAGSLTDHYNPLNKTVNLSQGIYFGRNAAAVAVAAHETGHAVQHATAYSWLQIRSQLVPAVSIISGWMPWLLLIAVFTAQFSLIPAGLVVLFFGLTTIFSFITLPVEFDASNRALAWIKNKNVVTPQEFEMSKDALWWAATTYVVAALSALVTFFFYSLRFFGGSRRN